MCTSIAITTETKINIQDLLLLFGLFSILLHGKTQIFIFELYFSRVGVGWRDNNANLSPQLGLSWGLGLSLAIYPSIDISVLPPSNVGKSSNNILIMEMHLCYSMIHCNILLYVLYWTQNIDINIFLGRPKMFVWMLKLSIQPPKQSS